MRKLVAALMYTALLAGANLAPQIVWADMSEIAAMRSGDMGKLNFHSIAKEVSDKPYIKEDGSEGNLADHQGKIVLLNFWATWCAPCRKEMPMLSELQTELGSDQFEVVTLATGRNTPPAMKKFFKDINVTNLPLHRDPKQKIARDMGVLGLPITVILDRDGTEIARLRGDADWASQNAKDILNAIIAYKSQ
jgi:thiol-disulfide isomerase/thioredoxin